VNNPPTPELIALGAVIAQARTGAGLGVPQLAKRLNMGVEQLQALEEGDLNRLPETVFVIAQARRIAESLGVTIDAEIQALRQSGTLNPRPCDLQNLQAKPDSDQTLGPQTNPRARAIGSMVASFALMAGLTAGSVVLWQQWQGHHQQQTLRAQAIARKAMQEAQTKQALATGRQPAPVTTLSLSSAKGTWLEVKTLKDKQLFRGDFKGRQVFPLNEGLRVLAGRPDLVLVQLGAKAQEPLGTISKVQWQTFAASKPKPSVKSTLPLAAKTLPASPSKPGLKVSKPEINVSKSAVKAPIRLAESSQSTNKATEGIKPTQAGDTSKTPEP